MQLSETIANADIETVDGAIFTTGIQFGAFITDIYRQIFHWVNLETNAVHKGGFLLVTALFTHIFVSVVCVIAPG